MKSYKSNNNIVYKCLYHVVWVTKYRKKYLVGDIEMDLKEICLQVAKDFKFEIIEMECDANHIHLLLDVDPQFGVHKAVKKMKVLSFFLLRKKYIEDQKIR